MTAPAGKGFQLFIPASQTVAEFTGKAIILGIIFGVIFGASTVYLGLRAGLTVSASIPIAVLAIAVFKRVGKSTILENNIVQSIGSAGESVAGGVVFTIPALLFLAQGEAYFNYFNIFTLAIVGGVVGVLFMVPLRRALIVKEHGVLPYPEGTACAEVLVAGERGGSFAGKVFAGLGVAFLYKPLATTAPIYAGGVLRWWVDRKSGAAAGSDPSSGMLYSTGLVAGGSLTGILIALLAGIPSTVMVDGLPQDTSLAERLLDGIGVQGWVSLGGWADLIGLVMFALLGVLLLRAARQKLEV